MAVISVQNLKKYFYAHQKGGGFLESVKGLFHRTYKEIKAVDDISFEIEEGEMVAFLGPNGAGKTTTLKMLSGILYPTAGAVHVLGFEPQKRKPEFQKQISLVMGQKNQLWWDLPPVDTFLLQRDIYEIPKKQYEERLKELVDLLEIEEILQTQVRKLSLGQRMKCELVMALLHRPRVLFLDEPTIGLDIAMQKKIRTFFKEYNKKYKTTLILTSHYMDDVKEICERVIMIDHGHKIYDGAIDEMMSKYATEKYLIADFEDEVKKEELKKIGKVLEFKDGRAKIAVPRKDHAKLATKLLSKFEVNDLEIREEELEDVILKFFGKKS